MITLYGTPLRKLVQRAVLGAILAALAMGIGIGIGLDVYELIAPSQISEVEVQTTERECLVGELLAPARTPFGDFVRTPIFICGENILYETDPGDALILNDYFQALRDFQEWSDAGVN